VDSKTHESRLPIILAIRFRYKYLLVSFRRCVISKRFTTFQQAIFG